MYEIVFQKDIKKFLKKLPKKDSERIIESIASLSKDPRPRWVEKLKSRLGYRIRTDNYRIIYTIDDGKLIVCVIDIDDRKDVYK